MVKSLAFFFESYYKFFIGEMFFVLVKSYSISSVCLKSIVKKLLILPSFERSILITYYLFLITLSLEKEIIVLGKKSGTTLEFCIQKAVRTLLHPSSTKSPTWLVPVA